MNSLSAIFLKMNPDEAEVAMFVIGRLVLWTIGILSFILRAIALYSIAKRRNIHNPWLAWIPMGAYWIMGSISDQYQYVVMHKVRSRRKILLGVNVANQLLPVLCSPVFLIAYFFNMDFDAEESFFLIVGLILFLCAVVGILSIWSLVCQVMCIYDIFASCNPKSKTLYFVLSIFFIPLLPVFLLINRNKDLGMMVTGYGNPYGQPPQPGYGNPYGQQPQPGCGNPYGQQPQPGFGNPYGQPWNPENQQPAPSQEGFPRNPEI